MQLIHDKTQDPNLENCSPIVAFIERNERTLLWFHASQEDHLGRPFQGIPEEHDVVVRWSRFENTVIKLSSIPLQTKYPHRDIAPVIERLVSEFGPERMIYGGGFDADATPRSYRAAFGRAESFIAHLPAADRAAILGGNAAKFLGFK